MALLGEGGLAESSARRLAAAMVTCLQGALLVRYAPVEVADAFCSARFGGLGAASAGVYGVLDAGPSALAEIVARTTPTLP